MFLGGQIAKAKAQDIPLRLLAYLGDAVLHLYERERQILSARSAHELHKKVAARVSASQQSQFLELLADKLTPEELELTHKAGNLKLTGYRRIGQRVYRRATAFEALIGFLYLTDKSRLLTILEQTMISPEPIKH